MLLFYRLNVALLLEHMALNLKTIELRRPSEKVYLRLLNKVVSIMSSPECETCKWQIDMSTSASCLHPVSLLARALN